MKPIQPRPGHLHSVSVNPGDRGGPNDGMDGGIAGSGDAQTSSHYDREVSMNTDGSGADTKPEGFDERGYIHNQSDASASIRSTSAGRIRNIEGA